MFTVSMPGITGIEAAASIRLQAPDTRIVALSRYGDSHYLQRMRAAGAHADVLKNEASAELVDAIEAVMSGKRFVSPTLAESGVAGQ